MIDGIAVNDVKKKIEEYKQKPNSWIDLENFYKIRKELVEYLIKNNITISTAESATAGFLISNFADIPGVSSILSESYVTYSNDAKIKILNIDKNVIDKYGVVSSETAKEMVLQLRKITNSKLCISVTGNLGPTVLEDKDSGLIYVAILYEDRFINTMELHLEGDRLENKLNVVIKTFEFLKNIILK